MIAYLDSSVFLRLILGQSDQLAEWPEVSAGVTSALSEVECLRTLRYLAVDPPRRWCRSREVAAD